MGDYPLDLLSPVRHVATVLSDEGGAPSGALSVAEMAASYQHPNTGDLARVRREHGLSGNDAAEAWLIETAIEELGNQVRRNGSGYALAKRFDELRYPGRHKLHRYHDPHVQFRDPFNPMTGRFSDNVRTQTERKDSPQLQELRESMRSFGWIPELPAIKDERGVVLVGHRRLTIAADLGIDPVFKVVSLGDGDEADAKRFALAVASNLGAKPFTADERKDIGEYLYGERGWTMQRIADALKVSNQQISKDLAGFQPSGKPARPRGGRPKGSVTTKFTPEQEQQIIRDFHEFGGDKSIPQIARELGYTSKRLGTPAPISRVIDQERGRRDKQEAAAGFIPDVPVDRAGDHQHRWVCADCGNVAPLDS